jgi:cytochrome c553
MKSKVSFAVVTALGLVATAVVYNPALSRSNNALFVDGQNPPHAQDIDGKTIPESSATQPEKPIILSKDSKDPKYVELKREAAFDHSKHNTDVKHTLEGKTLTACVYCHHTEQPMPVANVPYLKKSERNEVLNAPQLETSKQAVNSCRHCHFQVEEGSPKAVKYPRRSQPSEAAGITVLTNQSAYHIKCITCHATAVARDANLKAPQGCADCHVKK